MIIFCNIEVRYLGVERELSELIIRNILRTQGMTTLTMTGNSMEPILRAGDQVRVIEGAYSLGDILLYPYKENKILAHRWVGQREQRLLCKGDNAFRVEDIELADVLGKVEAVYINGMWIHVPSVSDDMITYSLELGHLFRKNRFNILQ